MFRIRKNSNMLSVSQCISSVENQKSRLYGATSHSGSRSSDKNSASSIVGPEKLFICTYMYLETFINIIAFYVFYVFNLIKQSN